MNILIQDTNIRCSYLLNDDQLKKYEVSMEPDTLDADVLFMVPNEFLLDEIPPSRSTDGPVTTIAIIDSVADKAYQLSRNDLEAYEVDVNVDVNIDTNPGTITFAIPSSMELMTEVPIFRRSLVQYGS